MSSTRDPADRQRTIGDEVYNLVMAAEGRAFTIPEEKHFDALLSELRDGHREVTR